MGENVQFTDRELDLTSVLWKLGSGTVSEVRAELEEGAGYTTVLKMLQILEEKSHVRHESEGRAYRYFPTVAPEDAGRSALGRIVNKIFHGSTELTLARLVEERRVSASELERMRRILDEIEIENNDEEEDR